MLARLQLSEVPANGPGGLAIAVAASFEQVFAIRIRQRIVRTMLAVCGPLIRTVSSQAPDVDGLPSSSGDVGDEIGVRRDRILKHADLETRGSEQFDANDLPDQRIAKMPDDDTDVAPHALAQRSDAVTIQHHVGVELHKKRCCHLRGTGVNRFMKGDDVTDHDDVGKRCGLAMEAIDRSLGCRFARGQHDDADVVAVTSRAT